MKVLATLMLVLSSVAVQTWLGFGVLAAGLLIVAVCGRIPMGRIGRAIKGISFLLLFTVVLNALFTPGQSIVSMGPIAITIEGLRKGMVLGLRLTMLVAMTTLLTASTSPLALAEGVEFILSPLRIIRVPTPELAMITSIALRFVPILYDEARRITIAQFARGVDTTAQSPLKRVSSLGSVIIPLFAGALRRADELGDALEARGFRPGVRRGRLRPRVIKAQDLGAVMACVVFFVVAWVWL